MAILPLGTISIVVKHFTNVYLMVAHGGNVRFILCAPWNICNKFYSNPLNISVWTERLSHTTSVANLFDM